jgi:FkbM family methyltransferase
MIKVVVLRFLRKYLYYLLSIFELLSGFDSPILLARIFLNLAGGGVKNVRLRGSGLRFKVRGAMDVWSVKETFLDRFYERYGFRILPGWNVMDIGAGVGDFSLYAALQEDVKVFAFEPYPESFALAEENIRLNGVTNVKVFAEAVSASSGKLMLDLSGGEPLQVQSRQENAQNIKTGIEVDALSLEDAFKQLGLTSCDLLKLDCEGAEYLILFHAPQPALNAIQRIVMEYHDNVTQYNHGDLAHFLNERGFEVETFVNPVHEQIGYLRASRKN